MLPIYFAIIETQEDRELFACLYSKYKALMFSIANRILNDTHASEDIVHDAFIRMIKNFEKFNLKNGHKTQGLIGIIVEGLAINEYNRRNRLSSLEDEPEDTLIDPNDIEDQIIQRAQYDYLRKYINQLDLIYQNAVLLKFEHQFSTKEIAELEGVSVDVVRQRLHRAKLKLQVLLAKDGQTI